MRSALRLTAVAEARCCRGNWDGCQSNRGSGSVAEATARVDKVTAEWNAALAGTSAADARAAQMLAQANAGTASGERAIAQARTTELANSLVTQEANLVTAIAAECEPGNAQPTRRSPPPSLPRKRSSARN